MGDLLPLPSNIGLPPSRNPCCHSQPLVCSPFFFVRELTSHNSVASTVKPPQPPTASSAPLLSSSHHRSATTPPPALPVKESLSLKPTRMVDEEKDPYASILFNCSYSSSQDDLLSQVKSLHEGEKSSDNVNSPDMVEFGRDTEVISVEEEHEEEELKFGGGTKETGEIPRKRKREKAANVEGVVHRVVSDSEVESGASVEGNRDCKSKNVEEESIKCILKGLSLLANVKVSNGDNNDKVDILETAKRRGMTFPRSRFLPKIEEDEKGG